MRDTFLTPLGKLRTSNDIGAVAYRSASSGQFIIASVMNTTYACKVEESVELG